MSTPTIADLQAAREDMAGFRETREVPFAGFEMREVPNGHGGVNLRFAGYASVTCANKADTSHAYPMQDLLGEYQESMIHGCFSKTIRECDTNFVVNHTGVSMARTKSGTLKLSEDSTGLHSEATLNPSRTDVQILRAAVEDGDIDEMSFSFLPVRQEWAKPNYDRRWITEVNMHHGDVSPCNFGANSHTAGLLALRSRAQHDRLSGRPVAVSRPARPESLVVLPDYTPAARAMLARSRAGRSTLASDPIAQARRDLYDARRRANR